MQWHDYDIDDNFHHYHDDYDYNNDHHNHNDDYHDNDNRLSMSLHRVRLCRRKCTSFVCPWIQLELCGLCVCSRHDNHRNSTPASPNNHHDNFRQSNDGTAFAHLTSDDHWNLIL